MEIEKDNLFCASFAALPAQGASILPTDLLLCCQREPLDRCPIQLAAVKIHGGNLTVVIGGVIVDPLRGVAAGGIDGDLAASVLQAAAAPLLIHRAQNVEELTNALLL